MTINVEELKKQGLTNLAELLESKIEDNSDESVSEDVSNIEESFELEETNESYGTKKFKVQGKVENDDGSFGAITHVIGSVKDKEHAKRVAGIRAGEKGLKYIATRATEIKESTEEQTSEKVNSDNGTNPFDKLFEGVDGLPEDFSDKLKVTFVANVNERVEEIVNEKLKTLEEKVAESLAEQEVEQEQSINTYLTYVAEQWLKENKQAIESTAQVKLTQSFMIGLRELFESHNIEIPEGKTDIVEELETELAESKGVIEALTAQLNSIKEDIDSKEKNSIVESVCAGLTETESEKFRKLAEEFVNEDVESFTRKVDAIKEYFKADTSIEPKKVDESTAEVIDVPEDKSLDESSEAPKTKVVSPRMQSYLAALRKGNRA